MRKLISSINDFQFTTYIVDEAYFSRAITVLLQGSTVMGLDIESAKHPKFLTHKKAGLDPYLSEVRLVQIYDGFRTVFIFDCFKLTNCIKRLGKLLKAKKFYAHYALYELSHFSYNGLPDLNVSCSKILSQLLFDAQHSIYDPSDVEKALNEEEPDGLSKYHHKGHSLEDCVARHFDIRLSKDLQRSDWNLPELSSEQYQYAAIDSVMTHKVGKLLYGKIKELGMKKHYALEKAMQHVIVDMQLRGFPVDWELHSKFVRGWDQKQAQASKECAKYFTDVNLNSGLQLEKWATEHFKKNPDILKRWDRTPKGKLSFNSLSLDKFKGIPSIKSLLEYKQYSKLLNTYGESFAAKKHPITGRVHCNFTLAETRTGRLSSRDPNLQNWPRDDSRLIFSGGELGRMVVADFSQIEIRAQAAFSRDPVMCRIFKEDRDIYCEMGSALYRRKIVKGRDVDERQFAKVVVLSLSYGMGANKLAERATIELGRPVSVEEAKRAWLTYRNLFKGYIAWCDRVREQATQLGYARTKLGKMRALRANEVFTKAPNTWVQGTSGEIMKIALVKMYSKGLKLCNSIHDEAISLCSSDDEMQTIEVTNSCMNTAFEAVFPNAPSVNAQAQAANNWWEAKD